ncbi:HTH domain-containing protein [Streptomyces sp. NBC_00212]|uniref:HTH domain-containing protein n=1 Tax=Streptomyces sp. NBC_00212 TaxID=2975684 RepID=UPI003868045D
MASSPSVTRFTLEAEGPEAVLLLGKADGMDLDPVLRALTLLRSGGEWTAADLAERLGTSVRTVRRDAQRLRRPATGPARSPGTDRPAGRRVAVLARADHRAGRPGAPARHRPRPRRHTPHSPPLSWWTPPPTWVAP